MYNIKGIKMIERNQYTGTFDISIHIADRCNKNCTACGHFAPLVPQSSHDVTFDEFKESISYLEIAKGHINNLILTGGEPTLNKDFPEIIKYAIDHIDDGIYSGIVIASNGLNKKFFIEHADLVNSCDRLQVFITMYDKNVFDEIKKHIYNIGYYFIPFLENDGTRERFYTRILTQHKVDKSIIGHCGRGSCVQLVGSRLYGCQYTANFRFFDKYFEGKHGLPDGDEYLDLKDVKSLDEIVSFLYDKNYRLCENCKEPYIKNNISGMVDVTELGVSKKEMGEWVETL